MVKNKEKSPWIFGPRAKTGLPGENRTHNRNLGGSRYIHLTTGRKSIVICGGQEDVLILAYEHYTTNLGKMQ